MQQHTLTWSLSLFPRMSCGFNTPAHLSPSQRYTVLLCLLLRSRELKYLALPRLQFLETRPLPNDPLLHTNLERLNDVMTLQTLDGSTRYLIIGSTPVFVPWSGFPFMLSETSIRTTSASSVNSMGIYSGIVPLTNAPVVITIVDGVRKLAHNWLSIDRIVPDRWKRLPSCSINGTTIGRDNYCSNTMRAGSKSPSTHEYPPWREIHERSANTGDAYFDTTAQGI